MEPSLRSCLQKPIMRMTCTLTRVPILHAVLRRPDRSKEALESDPDVHLQAAALTLGIDTEELGDGSSSFNQLGGDSLAAIQFAREVDNLCGTTLPVSFVLDHSHSMKDIVEKVCLDSQSW